jgi:hypothetical protein
VSVTDERRIFMFQELTCSAGGHVFHKVKAVNHKYITCPLSIEFILKLLSKTLNPKSGALMLWINAVKLQEIRFFLFTVSFSSTGRLQ